MELATMLNLVIKNKKKNMSYYSWNEFKNNPMVKNLSNQQKWVLFNDRINEAAIVASASSAAAGGKKYISSEIETTSIHIENPPRIFYSGETLQLIVLNQVNVDVTTACTFVSNNEELGTVDENGLLTITIYEEYEGSYDLTINITHIDGPTSDYLSVVHFTKIDEIVCIPSSISNVGYTSISELITGSTNQLLVLNQDSIDVTTACTYESSNLDLVTISSDGVLECLYDQNDINPTIGVTVSITYDILTVDVTVDVAGTCFISSGHDQIINVADQLILSGYTSGLLKSNSIIYWQQISGDPVTITNSGASVTTVTGFDVGYYTFRYRCRCKNNITSTDTVQITVTSNPDQFTIVVNDDYFSFNSVDESWIGLTINWGDGSPELTVSDIGEINHTYSSIDTYVIIVSGNISGITGGFSIYE